MDTTLYLGMSYQKALERKMDVVAHNVANMNTTAFKKERVVFRQYLVDLEGAEATKKGKVSFVLDHGIVRNLDQGDIVHTNGQLDVYIDGPGYIAVEGQNGETLYTRNGRMQLDKDGFLTTFDGQRILDNEGDPIEIELDDDNADIHIAQDGTITAGTNDPVRLGLYKFQNEQAMNRQGGSLYSTNQPPLEVEDLADGVTIKQFALEGSNVNSIRTITEMMQVMRSYQSVSRNMTQYQELREDSLDRLSRVQ